MSNAVGSVEASGVLLPLSGVASSAVRIVKTTDVNTHDNIPNNKQAIKNNSYRDDSQQFDKDKGAQVDVKEKMEIN